MYSLYDGDYLAEDLDRLIENSRVSRYAKLIEPFLDELAGSQDALETMLRRKDEYPNPLFNVRAVDCFLKRGYNISRIRPFPGGLGRFRILFALDPQDDAFYLLAIVEKIIEPIPSGATSADFYNYERNHPITERICKEYDTLGLPCLHG